ncbi:MAG TPA: 50S ribosomal protein L30 [Bacillota bacterium]|nr:50S ribosomal protein L30 [Bacillota bacterium]
MPGKNEATTKNIIVTLKHSAIGRSQDQKDTVKALGFKKLNQSLVKADTPAIRGMIRKIEHLVEVKEA